MQYEVAVAIAYLIGMTTAFLLTRRFVFAASGQPMAVEQGRFGLVNVAGFIQVWIVSVALVRWCFPICVSIGAPSRGQTRRLTIEASAKFSAQWYPTPLAYIQMAASFFAD
jgi:putative flippase GtrA